MPYVWLMLSREEKTMENKQILGIIILIGLSPILIIILGLTVSLVMQWFNFGFALSPAGILLEWGKTGGVQ